jgi:hypothetical protein
MKQYQLQFIDWLLLIMFFFSVPSLVLIMLQIYKMVMI